MLASSIVSRTSPIWVGLLLLYPQGASALPPAPLAPPSEEALREAQRQLEDGRLHRQHGHFEEAERALERAWRLAALPQALLDLAALYRATGRITEAVEALRRYLELRPDGPNTEALRSRLRAMERLRARRGVGRASHTAPPGRDGVTEGQPSTGTRTESPERKRPLEPRRRASPPDEEPRSAKTLTPWILLGAGGLLGALAGVTGVLALDAERQLEAQCEPQEEGRWICTDPSYSALKQRGALLATATDVLALVALLGASAGVALHLFESRKEDRRARIAGGCTSRACEARLEVRF